MPQETEHSPGWVMDKKVSVAVYITLAVQAFGFVWWAATTDATVKRAGLDLDEFKTEVKSEITDMRQEFGAFKSQNTDTRDRVIRMEEKIEQTNDLLTRILENLEAK
jgi:peptidoglycan hydrolase CwlO-like protein